MYGAGTERGEGLVFHSPRPCRVPILVACSGARCRHRTPPRRARADRNMCRIAGTRETLLVKVRASSMETHTLFTTSARAPAPISHYLYFLRVECAACDCESVLSV